MDLISNPKRHSLTQEELARAIEDFCAGCPDPVQAYSLLAENPEPMTDEQIVDRVLSMAFVRMPSVPASIVPADHQARIVHDRPS